MKKTLKSIFVLTIFSFAVAITVTGFSLASCNATLFETNAFSFASGNATSLETNAFAFASGNATSSFKTNVFSLVSGNVTSLETNATSLEAVAEVSFRLTVEGNEFYFTEKELLDSVDDIKDTYSRLSCHAEKVAVAKRLSRMGFDSIVVMNYMFFGLEEKIDSIIESIDSVAVDAKVVATGGAIWVESEKYGKQVDRLDLYNQMHETFLQTKDVSAVIKVNNAAPMVFAEELKKHTSKRGSFATNITGYNQEGRIHNIGVALSKFDGKKVEAGEKISFNEVVGDTTPENGYGLAKIIENGKFIDGYGGGVCQASTTLYNALLLSGVEILEVRPHSLRVGYVAPSFDAMVSYGYSDMVFVNNTGSPIYISTYSDNLSCGVVVFGEQKNYTVKRRSEILDKDSSTADNVNIKSRGYLEFLQNGDLIKTERIRNDAYYFPKSE